MNHIYIILGSNINKRYHLPTAVKLLRQLVQVVAVSQVYETVPVGLREQPNFFNAAVHVKTADSAWPFKCNVLHQIETQLKRQRTLDKNAPRTIDADIVLFNESAFTYGPEIDEHSNGDGRENGRFWVVPDPDLVKFPHVAVPIAELAPHYCHPHTGETLQAIANRLYNPAYLWPRPDVIL